MPALRNPRHERFAQALFEGKPANAAYAEAGYSPHDGNCIRLRGNERVQARLEELQAQTARSTAITVESICAELDQANAVAKERGQASAMVSASALRAKLAGLMIEKVEVGQVGDFDRCGSALDVATKLLELECRFIHVDDADRLGLAELMDRRTADIREYLTAIQARPIVGSRPLSLEDQATNERARQNAEARKAARLTNGKGPLVTSRN
jgi:hypothetical protein